MERAAVPSMIREQRLNRDYCPMVKTAPDGAVYVFICEYEGRKGLKPVLIPFSMLEKSKDDYGMTLQQTENEE